MNGRTVGHGTVPGWTSTRPSNARVELSMPARPDALQLARLSAGFVAAKAQLVYDDVEDLRLAIDELCLALLGPDAAFDGDGARLVLSYTWDDDAVEVSCAVEPADDGARWRVATAPPDHVTADPGGGGPPGPLARQILDALVDDHAVSCSAGGRLGWLRKTRTGVTRR